MSVAETVLFAAEMKLPRSLSRELKLQRVEEVRHQLSSSMHTCRKRRGGLHSSVVNTSTALASRSTLSLLWSFVPLRFTLTHERSSTQSPPYDDDCSSADRRAVNCADGPAALQEHQHRKPDGTSSWDAHPAAARASHQCHQRRRRTLESFSECLLLTRRRCHPHADPRRERR